MGNLLLKKNPVVDYMFITLGAALMAIGFGIFFMEAKVVPGGASGLAMAIHYLSGKSIPVGVASWIINIPLFIWGLYELGSTFGLRTFAGFTLSSLFIDLFRGDIPYFSFIRLQDTQVAQSLLHNDYLFFVLIGAVFLGVGIGIIFKFNGTTAGSDIVAAIMQKRFGVKPGQAFMIIDFFVIIFAGTIINFYDPSPDRPAVVLAFYAFFQLFVSSKIIDIVIDGFDYARVAYIISDKYDEIAEALKKNMTRGATALKSKGLYKNVERDVIFTVVTLKEVSKLTDLIKEIDPDAFVIINNVHEVLGKGFRRRI